MLPRPVQALVLASLPMLPCVGCGNAAVAQAVMPNGGHDTTMLAKCSVAASHDEPLVTEWPASYKARLEASLHEGAVAVEYSGCDLRIIDTCKIPGSYAWKKTTLSTDTTDISDEDELYAKLPLGAASLSGQLKTSGTLHVQTTVSGHMRLVSGPTTDATNGAECSRATHIVSGLSIGAFKLMAGGNATGKTSVDVGPAGVHGSAVQSSAILRTAGDPASCSHATKDEPNGDCRSPIQIFLTPIRRSVPLNVLSPIPDEKSEASPPKDPTMALAAR
jgi:hypothetical protein